MEALSEAGTCCPAAVPGCESGHAGPYTMFGCVVFSSFSDSTELGNDMGFVVYTGALVQMETHIHACLYSLLQTYNLLE